MLVAIGIAALLLGVGAIFVSQQLLSDDRPESARRRRADRPHAGGGRGPQRHLDQRARWQGRSDIEASGYKVGAITNTEPGFEKTEVMYADGQKSAAQKVARDLGCQTTVEPLDRTCASSPREADVVVIAGEDRAYVNRRVTLGAVALLLPARRDPGHRGARGARPHPEPRARGHRARRQSTRPRCSPAGPGPREVTITFFVRESDDHALVGIVDSHENVVRTLDADVALTRHDPVTYVWDGRTDAGGTAPPGRYRLLVELPGEDREMIWPRRITLLPPAESE